MVFVFMWEEQLSADSELNKYYYLSLVVPRVSIKKCIWPYHIFLPFSIFQCNPCDGMFWSKLYFLCAPGSGVFVGLMAIMHFPWSFQSFRKTGLVCQVLNGTIQSKHTSMQTKAYVFCLEGSFQNNMHIKLWLLSAPKLWAAGNIFFAFVQEEQVNVKKCK